MSVLGEQVKNWVYSHFLQQVGRGECADLATEALRAVGARTSFPSDHGNYVWGTPVRLAFAEPGDILQFRNHRMVIRNADGSGRIEHRGHPRHTAIVLRNPGDGTLEIAEQNIVYPGSRQPNRTVNTATIYFVDQQTPDNRRVTVTGGLWAYRPQPR